jgi:hypothetical protein
MIGLLDEQ